MTDTPLAELERLWNAHKEAREKVAQGTGFIEWSQTLHAWQQSVTEHADWLLAQAPTGYPALKH